MFFEQKVTQAEAAVMSLRQLAHLGDAVFHLFVREKEVFRASSAKQMHKRTTKLVSYKAQARAMQKLTEHLTEAEKDIVRRARNMKPAAYRSAEQALYRRATAFESLLGYLYLSDHARLVELMMLAEAGIDAPDTPNEEDLTEDVADDVTSDDLAGHLDDDSDETEEGADA